MTITHIDQKVIAGFKKISVPAARGALFVIFFWFGFLKLLSMSPAEPLVASLFARTISFIPFPIFYAAFAAFECLIGILFLIPRATRVVIVLLFIHMITTVLPLIFLPQITWQRFLAPTLEGQYIIKNLAIIALAIGIAAQVAPFTEPVP